MRCLHLPSHPVVSLFRGFSYQLPLPLELVPVHGTAFIDHGLVLSSTNLPGFVEAIQFFRICTTMSLPFFTRFEISFSTSPARAETLVTEPGKYPTSAFIASPQIAQQSLAAQRENCAERLSFLDPSLSRKPM